MILHDDRIVFIKAMKLARQFPKQMARYTQAQAEELALKLLRYERTPENLAPNKVGGTDG
jgi:hypothetical protein